MKPILPLIFALAASASWAQNVTATGNMKKVRESHQCHLLGNGKVLVFGGENGDFLSPIVYKEAELYNPSTGTWAYTGSMAVTRTTFASALLDNGKVLAIGGDDGNGNDLKSCELYDPTAGTWSSTGSLQTGRSYHAAVKLNNGKVLVAGSYTQKTELYDPSTGTWSYTGDMTYSHGDAMSMVKLSDGKVLATGGDSYDTDAELYDPSTGTWTLLSASLQGSRKWHSSILLNNGKVLITGSTSFSDQLTAELYDPALQTFTSTGDMQSERGDCPTVKMNNGDVLIYGLGDFFNSSNTKFIEVYHVNTGTWSTQTYNIIGSQDYAIIKLPNGKILVSGGSFTTGNGASDGCALISDNTVASVKEMNAGSSAYGVYPNPSPDAVNIRLGLQPVTSGTLVISDLNGKEVIRKNLVSAEATSVKMLSDGLYICTIYSESGYMLGTTKLNVRH